MAEILQRRKTAFEFRIFDSERVQIKDGKQQKPRHRCGVTNGGWTALNNNGKMVGGTISTAGSWANYEVFTYYPSQFLGYLPTSVNGYRTVVDINDKNFKTGYCRNSDQIWENDVPCFWSNFNSFAQPIELIEGYVQGRTAGINIHNQIVGAVNPSNDSSHPSHEYPIRAYIWDSINGMRFLSSSNNVHSAATSINNSGTVTVDSCNGQYIESCEAFIWDAANGMRSLANIIGSNNGWTFISGGKINNNGRIVGRGKFQGGGLKNFYWDGNTIYDLGLTANYTINGLNDSGDIVGTAKFNGNSFRAFVWNIDDGFQYIDDIAPNSDWVWKDGADINNKGQILVSGYNAGLNLSRAYILSPKKKTPLVFIPGITGSTLYEADQNGDPITTNTFSEVWAKGIFDPSALIFTGGYTLSKLFLDPGESHPDIVAVDALNSVAIKDVYGEFLQKLQSNGYKKYDINGNPKKRFIGGTSGCDGSERVDGEKPSLFVFAYDWRKSNADSAAQLNQFINCVQLFHPGEKVDLLTHSMGGLVARRYILDHQNNHKINKFISIAAPFLGAPKAINTLYTGRFLGPVLDKYFHKETIKKLTLYSPASHQLLPSKWYYDLDERPLAYKSVLLQSVIDYSYSEANDVLNEEFTSRPYQSANIFHNYIEGNRQQDNWSSDTSGIKYFHIYGVQKYNKTDGKIVLTPYTLYPLKNDEEKKYGLSVENTKGDGTVPAVSASRKRETDGGSVLLAPNTVVVRCLSPSYGNDEKYEHLKMINNEVIWEEIQAMLNDSFIEQPECENESPSSYKKPEKLVTDSSNLTEEQEVYSLRVYGVDRLQIEASDTTNTPVGAVDNSVPYIDYDYGSKSLDSLVVPHEVTMAVGRGADIKFIAPAGKVRIEIFRGTSRENNIEVIKYMDLQLPAGVTAWLKFNQPFIEDPTLSSENNLQAENEPLWVENLRYDVDGDSAFETEVLPTFILTGNAANDRIPPNINISSTVDNNQILITANASDNETGIKQIRYIVYGENTDHVYTAPFVVDSSQSHLVYISAEDNAGNRNLLAKWFDGTDPNTNINQTPPSNNSGWNTSNVTLELKATDDLGGSGIQSLTYSGSGAQSFSEETITKKDIPLSFPIPSTPTDFLAKTLNIYSEGITNLTFFAKDKAGNIEATKNYAVKIDRGLPISNYTSTENGQQTTFMLTAADSVSGVSEIIYSIDGGANQVYSSPFLVSNIGGHYITYYSKDFAGNEESPRTVYLNPAQVAKSILISEFRTRGYSGADDEFIELYNNGETEVNIGGWTLNVKQGSSTTSTTLATINAGTIIPARGHYLLRKAGTSNYSLSGYAEADQTYTGSLGDNCGIALVSTSSLVIDAAGFSSVTDATYREGAGLAPSTGITANGQYSFVRNYTRGGVLVDSNNNRADFIFVATDGGTYNNLKAVVGSPGPENLNSAIYKEGNVLINQIDDQVTLAESPNRQYDYTATSSQYPVGVLSVRRKLTNNTGGTINSLKIRITGITTKNSAAIFSQQAVLRLINSSDITVTSIDGLRTFPLKGLNIETVPMTIDGGLNSSLTFNLGTNGLANGESININLKSGIVTNGQYKLEFRVETKP